MADPPNAGNPVRLISPFHNIVGVGWGGGPVALIEVDGFGASFDVLTSKSPGTGSTPFPVDGQPSDTIDPNTYKRRNLPYLAGFDPGAPGDTPLVPQQGCWFGYEIGQPGQPPANQGTRIIDIPMPVGPVLNQSEFYIADYIDAIYAPTAKYYYLVDFGIIETLKITNGSNGGTYELVSLGLGPSPTTFPHALSGSEAALIAYTVPPDSVPGYGAIPGFGGSYISWSHYLTLTDLPDGAGATTVSVKVYDGGLFEKAGNNDVTWSQWLDSGTLLWQTSFSGEGATITIDRNGVV